MPITAPTPLDRTCVAVAVGSGFLRMDNSVMVSYYCLSVIMHDIAALSHPRY